MKLLLDTHTFLWYIGGDPALSATARRAIVSSSAELYLSVVSAWEIVIKFQKGTMRLAQPPRRFIVRHMRELSVRPLPVRLRHTLRVSRLPMLHRDPFDRL